MARECPNPDGAPKNDDKTYDSLFGGDDKPAEGFGASDGAASW